MKQNELWETQFVQDLLRQQLGRQKYVWDLQAFPAESTEG